jgi:hypothetical protein
MDDTSTAIPVERTGPAPLKRIGLVGAAAAAIVAIGILAAGASAAPAGTLAAGSGIGDAAGTIDLSLGAFRDGVGIGPGFGGGHGFGGIAITAISGSKLSLETTDGWTRTITVDSGTTYTESGDTIALSDLSVGDEIRFQQAPEDDGTYSIDAVAVIPPHAGGTVTAISGSTITVEQRDGTTATIKVTAATTYSVAGDDAALADVEVGMFLVAEGTENSDGSLTATEVRAADPDRMPGFGGRGGHGHGPWGDATPDARSDSAS